MQQGPFYKADSGWATEEIQIQIFSNLLLLKVVGLQ
jgi:hypothetical protein